MCLHVSDQWIHNNIKVLIVINQSTLILVLAAQIQSENVQNPSSSTSQVLMAKPVNMFQMMVYTAARVNAQQFVRVLFSTSVGKVVFSHYRDKACLPEDVARDNGHQELAQYLKERHQQ